MEVMTMLLQHYEYVSTVLSEEEVTELFNLKQQIETDKDVETVIVTREFMEMFRALDAVTSRGTLN